MNQYSSRADRTRGSPAGTRLGTVFSGGWRLVQHPGVRFSVLGIGVVAYGNLSGPWGVGGLLGKPLFEGSQILLLAAVLTWGLYLERLRPADLGLTLRNLGSSVGWGALAGCLMALPALVFFAFPVLAPSPVRYEPYAGLSLGSFVMVALVRPLFDTAIFEETLFRGVIQAHGIRLLGVSRGIAITCILFTLWHGAVTYSTIGHTNLASAAVPVSLLAVSAALPLAGAGLVFSLIRHLTGNLAGCVAAHWVVNSLMRVFLVLQVLPAA